MSEQKSQRVVLSRPSRFRFVLEPTLFCSLVCATSEPWSLQEPGSCAIGRRMSTRKKKFIISTPAELPISLHLRRSALRPAGGGKGQQDQQDLQTISRVGEKCNRTDYRCMRLFLRRSEGFYWTNRKYKVWNCMRQSGVAKEYVRVVI